LAYRTGISAFFRPQRAIWPKKAKKKEVKTLVKKRTGHSPNIEHPPVTRSFDQFLSTRVKKLVDFKTISAI
jgi:hypothetical protein